MALSSSKLTRRNMLQLGAGGGLGTIGPALLQLLCSDSHICRPMYKFFILSLLAFQALFSSSLVAGEKPNRAGVDFFEKKIRPVLLEHCYKCHSQDAQKAGKLKAELLLDSRAGLRKGGESGPVLITAKPADSLLLKVLRHEGDVRMPSKGKLPESVLRDFETWLAMGAPDPREGEIASNSKFDLEKSRKDHWAFQPLREAARPAGKNVDWVRTPIDAFILKKLEDAKVQPAPAADAATLLRRVYFDLIGLPPTPSEQQEFLRDPSPTAYENVVDDLLQRPQYGERWGRHWLDVARYAETLGFEHDEHRIYSWRYRDWVIDAFNADMPYDQFLTEQLAGDELKYADSRSQIGTSFLRLGTYESNAADHRNARYAHLDDVVSTVSMAFLGQTVQCARCHDHKFEPILQEDYYRMLAIFEPLQTVEREGNVPPFEIGNAEERAAHAKRMSDWQQKLNAAYLPLNQLRHNVLERCRKDLLADAKLKINEKQLDETLAALKTSADKRTKQQTELLLVANSRAKVLDEAIKRFGSDAEKAQLSRQMDAIAEQMKTQPQPTLAHVYRESGVPETWLFGRGETTRKVRLVTPGAPGVLGGEDVPEPKKKRFADTSGRRLWLAEWMTSQARPLVARVLVNRLWQQHFGRGLVDDANNLGVSGGVPSHPDQPPRHLRSQARIGASARAEPQLRRRLADHAARQRTAHGLAVSLPTQRAIGPAHFRDFAKPGELCRRSLHPAQPAHRHGCSWRRLLADEHWLSPAWLSEHGCLGNLWPGAQQSEPAGLCGAGCRDSSIWPAAELGERFLTAPSRRDPLFVRDYAALQLATGLEQHR